MIQQKIEGIKLTSAKRPITPKISICLCIAMNCQTHIPILCTIFQCFFASHDHTKYYATKQIGKKTRKLCCTRNFVCRISIEPILLSMSEMSEEWCVEQLAKLQIKESRLTTLNDIKAHLINLPANETTISAKLLTLLDSVDDCRDK